MPLACVRATVTHDRSTLTRERKHRHGWCNDPSCSCRSRVNGYWPRHCFRVLVFSCSPHGRGHRCDCLGSVCRGRIGDAAHGDGIRRVGMERVAVRIVLVLVFGRARMVFKAKRSLPRVALPSLRQVGSEFDRVCSNGFELFTLPSSLAVLRFRHSGEHPRFPMSLASDTPLDYIRAMHCYLFVHFM
eukprot:scaffold798_cov367-Pavlova_lutheri.AAC.11